MSKSSKPRPPVQTQGVTRQAAALAVQKYYSGPLPEPAALEYYEKVLPGLAERLVVLTENEQKIRRFEIRAGRIGSLFYGLSVCAVAAFAIYMQSPQAGAIIIGLQVAAVCTALITRRPPR
jgi:uncharacterized membrane protein